MDNEKFDWAEILDLSNRFWSDDIELVNSKQIDIIQKSIEEDKKLEELFSGFDAGFKMDYILVLENVKLIFELVLAILNIVILYKNVKRDSEIILEIRKPSKSKQLDLKLKALSDEELKELIKIIKASHAFNKSE